MFHQWKVQNLKFYFNGSENFYRFKIFKQNLKKIRKHNANPDKTHTQDINKFSDLTEDEFVRIYAGLNLHSQENADIKIYSDT